MNNDINYNIRVIFETSEALIYSTRLHNEKLDFWQGWHCAAGNEAIYIYEDQVYGGECKNDYLGTTDNWMLLEDLAICKRERCGGCTTDLSLYKYRP